MYGLVTTTALVGRKPMPSRMSFEFTKLSVVFLDAVSLTIAEDGTPARSAIAAKTGSSYLRWG